MKEGKIGKIRKTDLMFQCFFIEICNACHFRIINVFLQDNHSQLEHVTSEHLIFTLLL